MALGAGKRKKCGAFLVSNTFAIFPHLRKRQKAAQSVIRRRPHCTMPRNVCEARDVNALDTVYRNTFGSAGTQVSESGV